MFSLTGRDNQNRTADAIVRVSFRTLHSCSPALLQSDIISRTILQNVRIPANVAVTCWRTAGVV